MIYIRKPRLLLLPEDIQNKILLYIINDNKKLSYEKYKYVLEIFMKKTRSINNRKHTLRSKYNKYNTKIIYNDLVKDLASIMEMRNSEVIYQKSNISSINICNSGKGNHENSITDNLVPKERIARPIKRRKLDTSLPESNLFIDSKHEKTNNSNETNITNNSLISVSSCNDNENKNTEIYNSSDNTTVNLHHSVIRITNNETLIQNVTDNNSSKDINVADDKIPLPESISKRIKNLHTLLSVLQKVKNINFILFIKYIPTFSQLKHLSRKVSYILGVRRN